MAWNHKGVEIEMSGENFCAVLDGKKVRKTSIAAVRKEIDKRAAAKAQNLEIKLPVVFLRRERIVDSDYDEFSVQTGEITGINPDNNDLVGIEHFHTILPYGEHNVRLLQVYAAAKREAERLEVMVENREIEAYIPRLPQRKLMPHGEAVQLILDRYVEATTACKKEEA